MGIAALVIGIVAVIVGFIPVCGFFALLPAVVGLVLGIIDAKKKAKQKQPKGVSVAGIVLNIIAIVVIIIWVAVLAKNAEITSSQFPEGIEQGEGLMPGAGAPPSVLPGTPGGPPAQPGEEPAGAPGKVPGIGTSKGPPARPDPVENPGKPNLPAQPPVEKQ